MERAKLSVSPLFQERLKQELLEVGSATAKSEQNCLYRLDFDGTQGWARVKQFTNGTFYLEATDGALYQELMEAVERVTGQSGNGGGPEKAAKSKTGASNPTVGKIDLEVPYIGTDESGKGDYFGPLVIAGVYTNQETAAKLLALGVKDSKLLKDQQMVEMASGIQWILGSNAWHIIEISPKRYNELYKSFKQSGKNLNHLLAWGHAKVLEMMLEKNPDCTHAIADQFGSEHYIKSQLQSRGQQIQLHQTPKAEANIGVAAASILARVKFVQKVQTLSAKAGIQLPFGASVLVQEQAKALVSRYGAAALGDFAKLHFKTTESIGVKLPVD